LCLLECVSCFADLIEKILRFITRHAYIETCLHDLSFYQGCKQSYRLIKGNFLIIGVLYGVTGMLTMFGILTIAAITTGIGYLLMVAYTATGGPIFETLAPLSVIFVLSIVVGAIFMSTFDISCDTLLHCYIVDFRSNNGVKHKFSSLSE
jgi:drug/metabolite transporter (DMT)-like permease